MCSNRDDHIVHAQAEFLGGCFHDANVGLVRHQPVNVRTGEFIFFKHFFDHFAQNFYCKFKNGLAFHLDERIALHFSVLNIALGFQHAAMAAIRVQLA